MPRLPKAQRIQLWLDRLNRFTASQLTAAQFCQREQILLPSFYQWKRRLSPRVETPRRTRPKPNSNRTTGGPKDKSEGFTELVIKPTACRAQARLTNGITITFGNEPELNQLIVDRLLRHDGHPSDREASRSC